MNNRGVKDCYLVHRVQSSSLIQMAGRNCIMYRNLYSGTSQLLTSLGTNPYSEVSLTQGFLVYVQ